MPEQKSILIVGAERGLGLGLADQFFRRGWSVLGTARSKQDEVEALRAVGRDAPQRLAIGYIDIIASTAIPAFQDTLGESRFDVIFMNAGIYGPLHQSVLEATDSEIMESFMTNTIGPIRLAKSIVDRLKDKGTLCFMSSHRASVAGNTEGGLELYRASKSAQNMLSRGIYAEIGPKGKTILNIHPGWAATRMGTLDGTVTAEIDVDTSVRGVADVVERHMGSGKQLYLDYQDHPLDW